jgi:hypothetical protein
MSIHKEAMNRTAKGSVRIASRFSKNPIKINLCYDVCSFTVRQRAFLTHPAVDEQVDVPTQNQTLRVYPTLG